MSDKYGISEDGIMGGGIEAVNRESFKNFGCFSVSGDDIPNVNLVSCGAFIADAANYGGLPDHAPSMLHGGKGSTKSTSALHFIKEHQIKYPNKRALYLEIENGCFQREWAEKVGVDINKLDVFKAMYSHEYIEYMGDAIKTNQYSVIVADSTNLLLPAYNLDKASEDEDRMGANARECGKISNMYNKSCQFLKNADNYYKKKGTPKNIHIPSFLAISQNRINMRSMYGGGQVSGGEQWKHFPLVIMGLKPGKFESDKDLKYKQAKSMVVKKNVDFTYQNGDYKNKATGIYLSTGAFELAISDLHPRVKAGQIDDVNTILNFAAYDEIGLRSGAGMGQKLLVYPNEKFKSKEEMAIRLRSDEHNYWLMRACIIGKIRLNAGKALTPPDKYLQRCTEDQILAAYENEEWLK